MLCLIEFSRNCLTIVRLQKKEYKAGKIKAKCVLTAFVTYFLGLMMVLMNLLMVRIFDINAHKADTSFLDMCFTSRRGVECAYWISEKNEQYVDRVKGNLVKLYWDFSGQR